MCHSSQLSDAYNPKTKSYEFDKSFQYISSKFIGSDLILGNLETTIVDETSNYSGYPRFGSPKTLVQTLKRTGFNILSTANNHSADKGSLGIDLTIKSIQNESMIPIGTYSSLEDYVTRKNLIFEINNIKIAIYNYSYSTNGIQVPNGKFVRLIEEKTIKEDIDYAKEVKADLIIVWYHFGTEYETKPDKNQLKWVDFAKNLGADIIIGGHPHVVQPVIKEPNHLIAYSLGNFISAQNRPFTDGGMILHFEFTLNTDQSKSISDISLVPVWVYPIGYKILPLNDLLENKLEIQIPINYRKKAEFYKKQYNKVMEDSRI